MREIYFAFFATLKGIIPVTEEDLKKTLPATALCIFRKYFLAKQKIEIFGNAPDHDGF